MNRFRLLPVFLLIGSLIMLLAMFLVRGIRNRAQVAKLNTTMTAAAIETQNAPTETPLPTDTTTPSPTPSPEPTATVPTATDTLIPTATQITAPEGCNEAAFLADVTFPDGTKIDPDKKFTKTWRLLNNGNCTWDNKYKLYFVSGAQMSGPSDQKLVSIPVPPDKAIDISVELISPKEPGKYRGYWGLKDANGIIFGVGPANDPFYVEIVVVGADPSPSMTPTP